MMKKTAFIRRWDWSGYTIRRTRTGYVVSGWSRIRGERTGEVRLLPYSADIPADADLDAAWNEGHRVGEIVYARAMEMEGARILQRGLLVQ
jgi:hypothetical protein